MLDVSVSKNFKYESTVGTWYLLALIESRVGVLFFKMIFWQWLLLEFVHSYFILHKKSEKMEQSAWVGVVFKSGAQIKPIL